FAHIGPLGAECAHALVAPHKVGCEKTANPGRTRTLGLGRLSETKKCCRWWSAGEVLYLGRENGVASRRVAHSPGRAQELYETGGGSLIGRECSKPLLRVQDRVRPIAFRLRFAGQALQRPAELCTQPRARGLEPGSPFIVPDVFE